MSRRCRCFHRLTRRRSCRNRRYPVHPAALRPASWDPCEGVITKQQVKDAETWVHYLSEHDNVRKDVLQDNYQVIKEMTEEEVNISIKLLKDLIDYQLAMLDAHPVQG